MKYLLLIGCVLFALSGCGSSLPRKAAEKEAVPPADMPSEPADIAALPFENRTGDASLNWLRTGLSVTMSVRLKERRGLFTVDGSFIRQIMTEQNVQPSATLAPEVAISLSGSLFAESLITGAFEGREKELTISAWLIAGDTGKILASATRKVERNDRSRALIELIDALFPIGPADSLLIGTAARSAYRARIIDRLRNAPSNSLKMPDSFTLDRPEDVENAIRTYRQTIDTNPDFADAHFALGYAYDRQGDMEKAIISYRQAATLNPLNADFLYTLGYTYERKKEYRLAVESYKSALALTPNDADIAFSLGYAYEQIGEYAEAIRSYQHAIRLNPLDTDALVGLAEAYQSGGQLAQALEQYNRLLELKANETSYLRSYAAVAQRLQRWDDVIRVGVTLIAASPDDVETNQMLATAYREKGDIPKAIAAYETVIRLAPTTSAAYTSLGNIHVKQKQYDRAVQSYRAGIRANPAAALLYYNLGSVLMAQKDYRGAIEAFSGYIRTDPQGAYVESLRKTIEDLRYRIMIQE